MTRFSFLGSAQGTGTVWAIVAHVAPRGIIRRCDVTGRSHHKIERRWTSKAPRVEGRRLNLNGPLGAQRADVGAIRAIWAVQDKLALDADEETTIELKREIVNGTERTVWNPSLSILPKEF